MVNRRGHIVLGAVGLAMVIGFFLPWISLGELISASGYDLVSREAFSPLTRLIFALCPIGGAALVLGAVSGARGLGAGAWILGAGILLYSGYRLLQVLLLTTGVGLWIVITAALVAVIVGLFLKKG